MARKRTEKSRPFFDLRRGRLDGALQTGGYWTHPALLPRGGGTCDWLHLVLGTVRLAGKKRTALFRPKALVVTRADSPVVTRYEDYRAGKDAFPEVPWNEPVAMFPHKAVASMTLGEFEQKERDLIAACAEVTPAFASGGGLPDDFRDLWLTLTHPIVLPYLRRLAPAFFKALKVEK